MSDTSPNNHSIETSIALLSLKIDANQSEINTKLDGMIALNSEQLLHMNQTFENHRTQNEQKFINIERSHEDLEERVTSIEKNSAKLEGGKIAIFTILGGAFTAIITWLASHVGSAGHLIKQDKYSYE